MIEHLISAINFVKEEGFTILHETSDNGDQGKRFYFAHPESEKNENGRPLQMAQIDTWKDQPILVRLP